MKHICAVAILISAFFAPVFAQQTEVLPAPQEQEAEPAKEQQTQDLLNETLDEKQPAESAENTIDNATAENAAIAAKDTEEELTPEAEKAAEEHEGAPHLDGANLSLAWAIPFVGILLSIALFPLINPHFWHDHYGKISLCWGALFFLAFTIGKGPSMSFFYLIEVMFLEFIPFIVLLLALFTVAGGIQIKGEFVGTPRLNIILILIGGFLASWMGTTGAAMLMIRPLIRANAWRKYKTHTVVFFIFITANIGGCLTPLGDPPLFMGFLKGVSFFWTTKHLLVPMLTTFAMLTAIYFMLDTYYFKKEQGKPEISPRGEKFSLEGKRNLILLPLIPMAVLVSSLDLGVAFTLHHVAVPSASVLQVMLLLAITYISIRITPKKVRDGNEFSWEPIREVGKLFATIFITMVPPIAMLKAGVEGPLGGLISSLTDANGEFITSNFFWATGMLSSFLDNAPTYVIFFNTAGGNPVTLMGAQAQTLLAISMGAVFMGANTYIGNAPNFMVKSIAEEQGVPMPSFFGYIFKYSLVFLVPTFIILTFVFF